MKNSYDLFRFARWFGVTMITVAALKSFAVETNAPIAGPKINSAEVADWQALRFGMFIHWGPVSLIGKEIGWARGAERRGGYDRLNGSETPAAIYDNLYKEFNPTNFNAREWVAIAQAAGMKYIVIVSRHHDGFSLFDTAASDYKITSTNSPFRRDIIRDMAEATHAAGLKFGIYYSQPDWHNADAFTERHDRYLAYLKAQLRELLTNYGRVDVLWFDGLGKSATNFDGFALNKLARELQPHILINNRDGEKEQSEDFDTPEQRIGKYQDDRAWESCMTICRQWSWKPDDSMKSLKQCLQTLITCAGGDGNLLFNVGPMPDGRIEPRQVDRLKEMGAWLATNGEAIYGTRGGPWKPTASFASTRKGKVAYLHVLKWNGEELSLPDLPRKVISAMLLNGATVDVQQRDGKLVIRRPAGEPDGIDTIIKLQLDASVVDLPA